MRGSYIVSAREQTQFIAAFGSFIDEANHVESCVNGLNNGTVCLAIDKGKRGIGNAYTSREICPTRARYSVPRPARAPHGHESPSAFCLHTL